MSPLLNSSTRLGGFSLQSGHMSMLLIWLSLYSSLGSIVMLKAIFAEGAALLRVVVVEEPLTRSVSTWRFAHKSGLDNVVLEFGFVREKDSVIFRGRNFLGSLLRGMWMLYLSPSLTFFLTHRSCLRCALCDFSSPAT